MRKLWVRNLAALCGAQLLTLIDFSSYLPFIPFFVQELGVESYDAAVAWSAAFSSGAAAAGAWTVGSSSVVAGVVFLAIGAGVLLFVHPANGREATAAEVTCIPMAATTQGCGGSST